MCIDTTQKKIQPKTSVFKMSPITESVWTCCGQPLKSSAGIGYVREGDTGGVVRELGWGRWEVQHQSQCWSNVMPASKPVPAIVCSQLGGQLQARGCCSHSRKHPSALIVPAP